MTFNAIRPIFNESEDEITIQFGVSQGLAGVNAFDLVPGDGIIIDSVPGTGVDPFSSLLVAGTGISTSYNSGTRVWTITNTGGGGGGGGSTNLSVSTTTTTVVVASDTGTDATLTAATGSAAGVMTAAQFTKLDGIASGATANSADATLLARANHTGTQTWSTITSTPTTLSGYGITDAITSAAVAAGYQPLDSDLTAIAALTTTSFGRSLLTQSDAAATRTTIGAGTSSFDGAYSSLSGIPSTFAPASHSTDLLTSGTLPVARGGTGLTSVGSALQVLRTNAAGNALEFAAASGGIGGSTGSTDNRLLRSDGTGEATLQNTGITVDDSDNVTGVRSLLVGVDLTDSVITLTGSGSTGRRPFISGITNQGVAFGYNGTLSFIAGTYGSSIGTGGAYFACNNSLPHQGSRDTSLSRQSAGVWQIGTTANNALGSLALTNLTASGLIGLGAYTVATLPSAASNAGRIAQATDSSVTTNGTAVSGGGVNRVIVFSNGTDWKVVVA